MAISEYIGQFIFVPNIDLIAVIVGQDEDYLYYMGKTSICSRPIDIEGLSQLVFGVVGSFEEVSFKRKGLLIEYKLYLEGYFRKTKSDLKKKESLIQSSEF